MGRVGVTVFLVIVAGADCIAGCPGRRTGCVLGLKSCMGPIYRYRVEGGSLSVGYRYSHVLYLDTNSRRYRTTAGLGVGTRIPFGSRYGPFRWHSCGGGDGYWITGTSWAPYSARPATRRWWTQLIVNRGVVTFVVMWRGDVITQQC